MKSARITDRHAAEALVWLADDDISAVQKEEAMAAEVAEIERLLEEIDRELVAAERAERVRVSRRFTDQVRAQRAKRRAARVAVRSLPAVAAASATDIEGEAA